VSAKRKPGIYLAWTTVTYRSVLLMGLAGLLIFAAGLHFVFPQFTENGVKAVGKLANVLMERIAGAAPGPDRAGPGVSQQAHFTALDGTVRVKKSSSNSWVNATYSLPLEKGDVIQTASEGMARVVFNDGTNYTIKQDSLIVIEENSATAQQTQVAVNVTTGTVDLSTAMFNQGSSSKVTVAGATASLAPEVTNTS